mmetsp:Transcript_13845/g.44200  ORF Transcript_13845/g.44200 Transcript_13845/m.44200 type:complete len:200 (-) Transcript_13845:616-1215(-)
MALPSGSEPPSPKTFRKGPPLLWTYSCSSALSLARTLATLTHSPLSFTLVDWSLLAITGSLGIRSLATWSMKMPWDSSAGKVCFREGPMVSPCMSTRVAPFSATPATSKSYICTPSRVTPSLLFPWMEWCEDSPSLQFLIFTSVGNTGSARVFRELENWGGPWPFRKGVEPSSMMEKKRWSMWNLSDILISWPLQSNST